MISRPAPAEVLADWARDGLDGVDGPEFQACLERVNGRLNVNSEATHFNRNAEVLIEGLSACGLDHHRMARNASLDDDPRMCGYCNAGCQQGCKRSTLRTYLEDAAAAGARFVVDCFAERVTTADGRATGVDAVVTNRETGTVTRLRVDAPEVVVAAGGIESPALLLRSGIGGDAVGANLRLHPSYMVSGVYDEPVEAWNGQVITVMSFDFMDLEGGGGFFIAPLGLSPATWGGQSPWTDGAASREHFRKFPHIAAWHAISHDHGAGRVVLGPDDRALVQWGLEDEVDRRVAGLGHVELAKLHRAAGAKEVFTFHFAERRWREGEDFEAFLDELRDAPAEDVTAYSAHQMGACRMGPTDGRGGRRPGRAARRRRRVDRRRLRAADRAGREPHDHHHGARRTHRHPHAGGGVVSAAPAASEAPYAPSGAYGLFIGGDEFAGSGEFAAINPSTGTQWATLAEATPGEVDRAVAAATAAFTGWRRSTLGQRQQVLLALADAIEATPSGRACSPRRTGGRSARRSAPTCRSPPGCSATTPGSSARCTARTSPRRTPTCA